MWFVLLYFSLYWREFLLVGLSFIILAGLIGALNKNRASGVHNVNPRPQPHQTYCSTPAPRSESPLPSPNFNNTFTSIIEPHHTTVPLPEFWVHDSIGFFKACEVLFAASEVSSESQKYRALLVSLSKRPSVLQRISDFLPSDIPDDPYTSLKTQLLERFSTPSKQCLSEWLNECNRGTLTVCKFLQKLRSTLSSHYDPSSQLHEDLLRHCILNSVDPSTRKFLRLNDNMSLDNLAKHADKLIDRIDHQATAFSLQSPSHHNSPSQHLINEMLEKRITALQQSLSHNASSSHNTTEHALNRDTNAKPNFSTPTRSRNPHLSPSSNPNQACYYHQRFGARAFKCEGVSRSFSH